MSRYGYAFVVFLAVLSALPRSVAAEIPTITISTQVPTSGGGLIPATEAAQSESGVSSVFIATEAPTENAYQLVKYLPGATVATSDPYGISTQYSLTVRGLSQDEIGVVFEGAPQNDIGYYYAYPSQFVDAENIKSVTLDQGSASLSAPIINATGGLLSLSMRDPANEFGGLADASYGSYHGARGFFRLDTGELCDSGLKAFISYSHFAVDNWRGYGRDSKDHVDFKLLEEWGSGNRAALTASFNNAITTGYPEPALADWAQYGRSFNYDGGYTFGDTSYWKLYQNTFRDLYGSAPAHLQLTDQLSLDLTAYAQTGYGNSPGGTTLPVSGNYSGTQLVPDIVNLTNVQNGQADAMADFTGEQYRAGLVSTFTYHTGIHTLTAGFWYDYADDLDRQPFTPIGADGVPATLWADPATTLKLADGSTLYASSDHTETQIEALFIGDTLSLVDGRLKLSAGLKAIAVSRVGTNNVPGPQYDLSLNDFQTLPRGSVSWSIDDNAQVFFNVATNFRSPNEYTLYNVYYGGQLSSAATPNLKDEYSVSEELGYRYRDDLITGSITLFNYDFSNRQVVGIINQNGALLSATVNAGGQSSRGIDAELGLQPIHGFSPYVSAEFLDAREDDDFAVGTDYLPTKGKIAVRSPRTQAAFGIAYDDGSLFGKIGGKYTGSQYSTFLDDERIPSFTELDAAIGYRLPSVDGIKNAEIRLNLINLTDASFLSGVANPTSNAQAATGVNGTSIPGSAPSYYIGTGFAALFTVSAGF